jgi:hypothetical protein
MPSLISELDEAEQRRLLEDLNYLNMDEIKLFCKKHSVPYSIWMESANGARRKSPETDRKGVILDRIRHYLKSGTIPEATCFAASVISDDDLPRNLKPTDRLFYGQYDKQNVAMVSLLLKLTGGQFKRGAIARIVAREFWSKGIAPTLEEFALAWLEARANHNRPNPEWAYLSDRADGNDTSDWKQERSTKAKWVLNVLMSLEVQSRAVDKQNT